MAPENQWIREHLIKNDFRLKEGDPPEVTNFLFFLDMCHNRTYSFLRNAIAVRMNVRHFNEFEFQGVATVSQKAYVRAVEEANHDDKSRRTDFTQRMRFLQMFSVRFECLFKLSTLEMDWVEREIASRVCKRLVERLENLNREMTWETAQVIKEIDNGEKDEDERYWWRQFLEAQFHLDDEFPWGSDWAGNPKHKNDIAIIYRLICRFNEPWVRSVEEQAAYDARTRMVAKHRFEYWCDKLAKLPMVDKSKITQHGMEMISKLLAQVDVEIE